MADISISNSGVTTYLSMTFNHAELTAEQRRGLKMLFDLNVPAYQQAPGYQGSKDLTGSLNLNPGKSTYGYDTHHLNIHCTINSAYVCQPIEGETVEVAPDSYTLREGNALANLTVEEKLAYVEGLIAKKTLPQMRQKYECVPAESATKED